MCSISTDASESASEPPRAGRGGRVGTAAGGTAAKGGGVMGGSADLRVGNLESVGVAPGLIANEDTSLMSSLSNGFDVKMLPKVAVRRTPRY